METINPEKLLLKIIPIFDALGLRYFITGGFAVSVWGRPRATFDIDIVINLIEPQIIPLAEALRKISKAGYIDEETAKKAVKLKKEFNFIDPESGLKVDFWIMKNDKIAAAEFERRVPQKIGGKTVYFISPEDLILSKLRWCKESESSRHLEDIESVLKITKIDAEYLRKQALKQSTIGTLNKILNKH